MLKPEDKPQRSTFRYMIPITRNTLIELNNRYIDFNEDPRKLDKLLESVELVLYESDLEKDADDEPK